MKLLIAVDSAISAEVLVDAVGIRPGLMAQRHMCFRSWQTRTSPRGVARRRLRKGRCAAGNGRRGEQIATAAERLERNRHSGRIGGDEGRCRHLIPFFARKWSSDLIFVRAHVRKDFSLDAGQRCQGCRTDAPCTVQIVRDVAKIALTHWTAGGGCCSPRTARKLRWRQPSHCRTAMA